ncbi:MAG: hypothetical protein HQL11_02880 [Candidatus Omnitrophica bacterium]|nr:hypothetical protein [Candidatus Omnitrophota bacterium]
MIALAGLVMVLAFVRMVPVMNQTVEWTGDRALHWRLSHTLLTENSLPGMDSLAQAPRGRNWHEFLPAGGYYLTAAWARALDERFGADFDLSILLLMSLSGALIGPGIYGLARLLGGSRRESLITAFLAGVIPVYLERTFAYSFRFEVVGIPLAVGSLYFFASATATHHQKGVGRKLLAAWTFAALTALCWRFGAVLALWLIICSAAMWIREMAGSGSEAVLRPFGTAVDGPPPVISRFRIGPHLGFFVLGCLLLAAKPIVALAGQRGKNLTDLFAVLARTHELQPFTSPWINVFERHFFVVGAAIWILTALLMRNKVSRSRSADLILATGGVVFGLSLCAVRYAALAGPFVAVAGCFVWTRGRMEPSRWLRRVTVLLLVCFTAWMTVDAGWLLSTRAGEFRMSPELRDALAAVGKESPADAVILSGWGTGYDVQLHAGRATFTDALLEDPQNIRRIHDAGMLLESGDEDGLWDYAQNQGITHILLSHATTRARLRNRSEIEKLRER